MDDHDRTLNKRGKAAAQRMGALLIEEGFVPDRIVSSTAKRACSTAERVAQASGFDGELELRRELYLAAPQTYLDVASRTSDDVDALMLVGHNPGMEVLVLRLTGHTERFPTAALAQIEVDLDSWADVSTASARLLNLWRPRDLM